MNFTAEKAVILIGHGSRAIGADDDMEKLSAGLRKKLGITVETCRLEGRGTTFAEAFEKCAEMGAKEVLVIPYFLHFGVHLRRDIPNLMRVSLKKHPQITLILGKHLGFDEALVDLVAKRITESKGLGDIRKLSRAPINKAPGKKAAKETDE
jgi:sirohydrochlorin ferrochelatase